MSSRPLHAVVLPPSRGGRLLELLAAALDGSGPALLPLDPALPRARLTALLDAFAPAAVQTVTGLERPGAGRAASRPVLPGTAVVVATSGSTGAPKGAELSAAALLASARAGLRRIGAADGQRWLCCLPTFHVAGLAVLVRSLLAGSEPVFCDRLDAAALAAAGRVHVPVVPTQLRRLLESRADLTVPRTILLGGAAPGPGLTEAARAAGARIVVSYGMTETCGGCVYDGLPLDGVTLRIGADSRIQIAGPVLFTGYRLRPDLTDQARDGAWLRTSDLGRFGPSGELIVTGRADAVITTGGEKVVAGEVEAVLARCPGVRAAAVIGLPDAEWGELVTAVIVPADQASPPGLAELRARVLDRLPAAAAPRALLVVAELPLLPTGKPDPRAVREQAATAALTTL